MGCCLLLVRKFKRKSLKIGVNKKKINETVVKFEASSVISLIPSSHVTTTPFFKKSNCRNVPPPHAPVFNFFQCICLLFSSPDLIPRKKRKLLLSQLIVARANGLLWLTFLWPFQ